MARTKQDVTDAELTILQFLWDDPLVQPRDPALASEVELPRQHLFSGVGDLVMRNGWGKDSAAQ